MKNKKMNSHDMYWWIYEHPKLNEHEHGGDGVVIEITPHMVCPLTNRIEEFEYLNTKMQFWVELMHPHIYVDGDDNTHYTHAHDWELDCGGDTWHEAVEALYQKVLEKYGHYNSEELEITQEQQKELDDFFANIKVVHIPEMNDIRKETANHNIKKHLNTIEALKEFKKGKYKNKEAIQRDIDTVQGFIQKENEILKQLQ